VKAKRIILVRHGESEGNVDRSKHETIPDHEIALTNYGVQQAISAGNDIKEFYVGNESIRFYCSPYRRTRETLAGLQKGLGHEWIVREDVRLREQEWGNLRKEVETLRMCDVRDAFGHFYWRFPDGESGADVYNRLTTFIDTLHRDMEKPDFPDNVIIVSHGYAIRVFLMRWFHYTVEQFQSIRNPDNCEYYVMERYPVGHSYGGTLGLQVKNDYKYKLITPLRHYEN
jgi:broad specificity phosphatase PhoE